MIVYLFWFNAFVFLFFYLEIVIRWLLIVNYTCLFYSSSHYVDCCLSSLALDQVEFIRYFDFAKRIPRLERKQCLQINMNFLGMGVHGSLTGSHKFCCIIWVCCNEENILRLLFPLFYWLKISREMKKIEVLKSWDFGNQRCRKIGEHFWCTTFKVIHRCTHNNCNHGIGIYLYHSMK